MEKEKAKEVLEKIRVFLLHARKKIEPKRSLEIREHRNSRHLIRRIIFNWEKAFDRLLPLGGISHGNKVTLYSNGDEAFCAMKDAIYSAQKRVWLETYTIEPDEVGLLFRDALTDAARRGCDVVLLYDHFGSSGLSWNFLKPLLKSGAKAQAFNPIWPWRRHGPLLFRDHRKLLVVDNKVAFCGGMNIGRDYGGERLGNNRFRDTQIKIEGPGVFDLANVFLASLRETTGEDKKDEGVPSEFEPGIWAQVLSSNMRRNLRTIQNSMDVILSRATRYCYFTTPYFLPFGPLRKAMIEAAERGVDVRILTAGLSDVPLMRRASQHVYGQFLKAGIRIYEYYGKTLHAKTATIDGVYASVGSYNLDQWSARRNLEVTVAMLDGTVAKDLENHFRDDLAFAKEVTMDSWRRRSWLRRLGDWLAYLIMRL